MTIIKISDYFEEKNIQVYSVVTNFFFLELNTSLIFTIFLSKIDYTDITIEKRYKEFHLIAIQFFFCFGKKKIQYFCLLQKAFLFCAVSF